ncbi:hypothetical protein IQ37_16465 [Chryseobacterium piperi]|uniref:Uncharacterized protein n=1 Tax=Chryseobacterium piperi TaxID=558152 RepID=A0A086AQR2_9FLAO|nr:hypothetical protein [Chryseobacterium piperi]ASW73177.1 hypothetical protein CJF12_01985 [Chryseobacterium piperi]KFF19026.1 hypothetical protein IQ37_16465 [Chryseobacterium piperi]
MPLKRYTAKFEKRGLTLFSESNSEIGKITRASKIISWKKCIVCDSKRYHIRSTGFLWNDIELSDGRKVIYYTDFGKDRIVKAGEDIRVCHFELGKGMRLYEQKKLIIDIQPHTKWFKNPVFTIEMDDSVDEALALLFLYYSSK